MGLKKYMYLGLVLLIAYSAITSPHVDEEGTILINSLNNNELKAIQPLANQLKGGNIYDSMWNIIFWEEDNIQYNYYRTSETYSSKEDWVQEPTQTISYRSGVCIDYAVLTAGLLLDMGYEPYIFILDDVRSPSGHAFCVLNISGKLYAMDQHAPITDVDNHICNLVSEGVIIPKEIKYYKFWIKDGKLECKEGNYVYNINHNELPLEDKRKISNAILNYMTSKYPNLKPDSNINNMESMRYLPKGYSYGIYAYQEYNCTLHPEFGKYYGEWLDRRFSGHLSLTEKNEGKSYEPIEFDKYRRIWVKVEDNGGSGKFWIYLAK